MPPKRKRNPKKKVGRKSTDKKAVQASSKERKAIQRTIPQTTRTKKIYRSIAKKEYGVTDKMLETLPFEETKNPHYKSGPPARLYNRSEVEQLANSVGKEKLLAKRAKRSEVARKAAERRAAQLIERAEQLVIEVVSIPREQLITQACDNYNSLPKRERDGNYADQYSDQEFLERITVNYIRHRLTKYEDYLAAIEGEVGVSEAYSIIRERILDKIADVYPWLSDECLRQDSEHGQMDALRESLYW